MGGSPRSWSAYTTYISAGIRCGLSRQTGNCGRKTAEVDGISLKQAASSVRNSAGGGDCGLPLRRQTTAVHGLYDGIPEHVFCIFRGINEALEILLKRFALKISAGRGSMFRLTGLTPPQELAVISELRLFQQRGGVSLCSTP